MNKYDFIAIGDTVTDAFIRLKEASVHCNIDHESCEICMRFGDKIPYEFVEIVPAVGNSANSAVSAARLGLSSALIANIGKDRDGEDALSALQAEKVGTEFIKIHEDKKTNYHYVLWYEDDRTILIKHEEYDYKLPDFDDPKWIYFSSMGENSLPFHIELERYLVAHPSIKLAFQPGTFQIKFGKYNLAGIYKRTEVFLSNKEEAQRILETDEHNIKKLLEMMAGLGPKIVVITDGVKGAHAYETSSAKFWSMRLYPDPKPPYSRTGAGDAFSSTFVVAISMGKSVPEALRLAPINSMSVVQHIGARAGLLTMPQIEEYLKSAPPDYEPKEI